MSDKYAKIGRQFSNFIRNHMLFCIVIIALALITLFIYCPRNVKNLLYESDKSTVVEIVKIADEKADMQKITINSEQQKELFELCKKSYVQLKLFHKDYVNSNTMGYLIVLSDNQDTIHFLSPDIISINGIQYKIYGRTLSTEFKLIIEGEE